MDQSLWLHEPTSTFFLRAGHLRYLLQWQKSNAGKNTHVKTHNSHEICVIFLNKEHSDFISFWLHKEAVLVPNRQQFGEKHVLLIFLYHHSQRHSQHILKSVFISSLVFAFLFLFLPLLLLRIKHMISQQACGCETWFHYISHTGFYVYNAVLLTLGIIISTTTSECHLPSKRSRMRVKSHRTRLCLVCFTEHNVLQVSTWWQMTRFYLSKTVCRTFYEAIHQPLQWTFIMFC